MAPINDDGDGHLAYKLGDIVEHDSQRCEFFIADPDPESILRFYSFQSKSWQRWAKVHLAKSSKSKS